MSWDRMNDVPISAREALSGVAVTGLVAAGIGAVYDLTGLGVPCPFRMVTGWLCPFCGGTHLVGSLLRGDVVGAWQSNQLALLVGVGIAIRSVGWLLEVVLRRPPRRWLPAAWSRHAVWILVAVGVVWVLVRNLVPGV